MSLEVAADRLSIPRSAWSGVDFNVLALSGGAAGGAFGAGVLVGLTKAGRRPPFAIVTGVSTGALIAPFAFLGSQWDARLTDAYTGGHAEQAFSFTSLSSPFDGGLFQTEALERLVFPFVDEEVRPEPLGSSSEPAGATQLAKRSRRLARATAIRGPLAPRRSCSMSTWRSREPNRIGKADHWSLRFAT